MGEHSAEKDAHGPMCSGCLALRLVTERDALAARVARLETALGRTTSSGYESIADELTRVTPPASSAQPDEDGGAE